jgi:hypothetical protein
MIYSSLQDHAPMVFDETRNRAYRDAMLAVITPESVVLDLGAGVGVLGLLAAKAGARKVYCVEPSQVITHVQALAAANGVAGRMEALRGRIEVVDVPEQVDVLVSVFTGNLLFTEGLLPSLYYARDRYLKTGGAMIPDRARLLLAGVEAGAQFQKMIGRYREPTLGLDLSPLATPVSNIPFMTERGPEAPRPITRTVTACALDFTRATDDTLRWQGELEVMRDGELHGLLGWIELRLGDTWLSTAPDAPEVHWRPMLLPLSSPIKVAQGQVLRASFRHIDDTQVYWSVAVDGSQPLHHSTVLGNTDLPVELLLSSPACDNPPVDAALLLERVLAGMREGKSNQIITTELLAAMPDHFRNDREARKRIGAIAARYRSHPSRPR